MHRDVYLFDEFKKQFIKHAEGGYYAVCVGFKEDHGGNLRRVVQMDMICEWRLPDLKINFIEVQFGTEKELDEIIAYLRLTTGFLTAAIIEDIDKLKPKFADTIDAEEDEEF